VFLISKILIEKISKKILDLLQVRVDQLTTVANHVLDVPMDDGDEQARAAELEDGARVRQQRHPALKLWTGNILNNFKFRLFFKFFKLIIKIILK
jgi:hypothetical protein